MAARKKVYVVGSGGNIEEYDLYKETATHYVIGYSRVPKGEDKQPYDTSPPKVYTTDREEALALREERLTLSIQRSEKYLASLKAQLSEVKKLRT